MRVFFLVAANRNSRRSAGTVFRRHFMDVCRLFPVVEEGLCVAWPVSCENGPASSAFCQLIGDCLRPVAGLVSGWGTCLDPASPSSAGGRGPGRAYVAWPVNVTDENDYGDTITRHEYEHEHAYEYDARRYDYDGRGFVAMECRGGSIFSHGDTITTSQCEGFALIGC
jgi:hypothetical protein